MNATALPELVPGMPFGLYRIEHLLGRGGMGAVYVARDPSGQRVVVKVITGKFASDPMILERFRREAMAASRIDSPNVIRVFAADRLDGRPFIVMELVDGTAADVLVRVFGRLEPELAATIVQGVAHGLAAAERIGVIHRDVKPGNVLVGRDGSIKLADFGIAKFLASERGPALPEITRPGAVVGSPSYVAPEQGQGDPTIDARADVYALGVTFYQLLTGRLPFVAETVIETIAMRLEKPPRPPREHVPSIAPEYEAACLALMDVDRNRRPTIGRVMQLLAPLVPPDGLERLAELVTRVPRTDRTTAALSTSTVAIVSPDAKTEVDPTAQTEAETATEVDPDRVPIRARGLSPLAAAALFVAVVALSAVLTILLRRG